MIKFYDTSALLDLQEDILNGNPFFISSITLKQLETIKTSANKDLEIKYRARKLIKTLINNQQNYIVIPYSSEIQEKYLSKYNHLSDNNDSKIIATAVYISQAIKVDKVTFVTSDICCYSLAKIIDLPQNNFYAEITKKETDNEDYHGFKEIYLDTQQLTDFYETCLNTTQNFYDLKINQYLIIRDKEKKQVIDQYKMTEYGLKSVPYIACESKMFGKVKPKDIYQRLAIDSMKNNQITLLGGPAGSGKTFLALSYLFSQLEKDKISKIIIFVNPVGARNTAKLGYYPGTMLEKVLSTQAGHVLSSKIGSITQVERLIENGTLEIIPAVDARGYEVPPDCAVYILQSQNLTTDTMRMLLQRVGENTQVIIDGDRQEQTDMQVYAIDNGMKKVSEVFKGSSLYGQIDLQSIYRSPIAELAQKLK